MPSDPAHQMSWLLLSRSSRANRIAGSAILASALLSPLPAVSVAQEINPPLGPYTRLQESDFAGCSSFTSNDRVVLTPYFYWYDCYSSAHIIDADGTDALTDHPPTLTGFSFRSVSWHKTQLEDMIAAGIDVLLPVYWGEPSQRIPNAPVSAQPWSYAGIPPLVQAREELVNEGRHPPFIGMFYDTSTLQYNAANERIDLTTPRGRQWFYESVRDFYSIVPPKHWAMIDGKPVVFLYSAAFASRHDQTCIAFLRESFARDFGGRFPYVVREISWSVNTESVYAWGGALGLKNPGTASLGPGYDHSAVPGREPLIVPREGGAFFERNWVRFLRNPSRLVMIETWNEYHEGTDVAASREYGRAYIDLNRKYVDMFRQGIRPPRPRGPYSDAKSASVTLGATNVVDGLEQVESADGATRPAEAGGLACREAVATVHLGRYVYFRVNDSFKWADSMLVDVEVEYFDTAGGSFTIEFDGSDPNAPFQGAYSACKQQVSLLGSRTWKTARLRLLGARLLNSQNSGADFRIALDADRFYLRCVRVTRLGVPAEAGETLHGCQEVFGDPSGPQWVMLGDTNRFSRPARGLLSVSSGSGREARLLATIPGGDDPRQEILARVRIVSRAGGNPALGGISAAADTNDNSALDFRFVDSPSTGLAVAIEASSMSGGPTVSFSWQTNTWYWLRLRHQTNRVTNYPDVWARIWLADGETREPDDWTLYWDYYPARAARQGWAGIAGAPGTSRGTVEFDYFLLKTDGLPEIKVSLPALKAPRSLLVVQGHTLPGVFQFTLHGQPDAGYWIEHSSNFTQWSGCLVTTDMSGAAGFTDPEAGIAPVRFYRAREN